MKGELGSGCGRESRMAGGGRVGRRDSWRPRESSIFHNSALSVKKMKFVSFLST